ncbi:hypothetical protein KJ365_04160 [Glaciecola sp. XM2]|jgi:hypothetical protein|uniref:hypothetical protein n=1 Tax=Glaciecola sp. XM2 TaxID=1914931 RepID=UPI001BDE7943|nr:hypothetical protein [Glaciecola sp. XM2]MBT1450063.1 hypothetical protein [Glaciecola sp. XM2]
MQKDSAYRQITHQSNEQSDKPYQAKSMTWVIRLPAQRLKRVFNIDISECEKCEKRNISIIAWIIDSQLIHKILAYLEKKSDKQSYLTTG